MIPSRSAEHAARAAIRELPASAFVESDAEECALVSMSAGVSIMPIRSWKSRRFLVMLYPAMDGAQRITVQRSMASAYIRPQNRDNRPISWDELMEVKRAIGFGEAWAVEIYPPDESTVDVAMMRHLFLCERPAFAW